LPRRYSPGAYPDDAALFKKYTPRCTASAGHRRRADIAAGACRRVAESAARVNNRRPNSASLRHLPEEMSCPEDERHRLLLLGGGLEPGNSSGGIARGRILRIHGSVAEPHLRTRNAARGRLQVELTRALVVALHTVAA
jgi:hypothetical protein